MPNAILVIGSGGREQALAWKLAQSPSVDTVYVAPGNGGSRGKVKNVDIAFDDVEGLLDFAREQKLALSVVGQEAASEAGVVDAFQKKGLPIFGPTKAAATIETSKTFSKDLMASKHIPTASYKNFNDPLAALTYAKTRPLPVVLKADGLATGKGVIIAHTQAEIETAIQQIMVEKSFGKAGNALVVEDFLAGQEASLHALCDGHTTIIFPPSQDHKQINDNDQGPNTGGMGVYAPVDWISMSQLKTVQKKIVEPALAGLAAQGSPFVGCLYPGVMIDDSSINVVEFNARFGDPEAEVYMRLLDGDLFEILAACVRGELKTQNISWHPGFAVSVVIASPGYPNSYPKGLPITGLEQAERLPDIVIFHAGTTRQGKQILTSGGRVLNVTATGKTLDEALKKAYAAITMIHFDGMHYRTDIGRRDISTVRS